MTNFKWQIVQMTRKTDGEFVTSVHYVVIAEDENHRSSTFGVVEYSQEDGVSYEPFNLLTEEQVLGWVFSSVNKTAIESNLQEKIQVLKAPVLQTGLPWAVIG